MASNKLIYDYYVIADLGVDDDEACSKGHNLDRALEKARDEVQFGANLLRDRQKDGVLHWAETVFGANPDYYVFIVERCSKGSFIKATLVYESSNLHGKYNGANNPMNAEEQVSYFQDVICRIIEHDKREALMEKRRKAREELK